VDSSARNTARPAEPAAGAGTPNGAGGPGAPRERRWGGPVPAQALHVVKVLGGLSDDDLAWLAERTQEVVLAPGEALFAVGDPPDSLFLVLEGTVHARRDALGPDAPVFVISAGDVTGLLPFSRMKEVTGTGRAVTRVRAARFAEEPADIFAVPRDQLPEMIRECGALTSILVHTMIDRARAFTSADLHDEKMLSLGKLSAGLAHELNNPAAAVRRGAAELRKRLGALERLTAGLTAAGVGTAAATAMGALRQAGASPHAGSALGALERGDREDRVTEYLDGLGVKQPWLCAPTFVDAGLDVPALETAMATVPDGARPAAMGWLEAALAADALVTGVEQAAERISTLVGDIKRYTHMDRAREREELDVRPGLDSTLAIFAHKVKEKKVQLVRDYAGDTPKVIGCVGELNQVWTNLVDNALDAAPAGGRVEVRTRRGGDGVEVEIRDNGPGIPRDIVDRIWDPFFTTKEVGQGTGLGLDIARRIVERQHRGTLGVTSEPGDTRFTVRLPRDGVGQQ
jgi:signal transduction histidine kinase